MKPDWEDAPEWAEWLAMNRAGGLWYWWSVRPVLGSQKWEQPDDCGAAYRLREIAGYDSSDGSDWSISLERRPATLTLLKALQEIADLGNDGEHSGDRHARCRDIAREAIAKATTGPTP